MARQLVTLAQIFIAPSPDTFEIQYWNSYRYLLKMKFEAHGYAARCIYTRRTRNSISLFLQKLYSHKLYNFGTRLVLQQNLVGKNEICA